MCSPNIDETIFSNAVIYFTRERILYFYDYNVFTSSNETLDVHVISHITITLFSMSTTDDKHFALMKEDI